MKFIIFSLIFLFIVYILYNEIDLYDTVVSDNNDAVCLDGIPYKFFFHKGNVNKLVIYYIPDLAKVLH